MAVYVITLPDAVDPGVFGWLEAVEEGSSTHTLSRPPAGADQVVLHSRLGVTIRRLHLS